MSVNLQGAAYLSEAGTTGTISITGLDSLIRLGGPSHPSRRSQQAHIKPHFLTKSLRY